MPRITHGTFADSPINARILTREATIKKHKFRLVLSGVAKITPQLADALYEATEGDIEFNMSGGVAYLEFVRAARFLHDAIRSAIHQVEGANVGVRVVRVESDAANIIAKINAELLGATA